MSHDVTSAKNERIKALLALAEAKERRARGVFAVEGAREIDRALRSAFEAVEAYACPEALSEFARGVLRKVEVEGARVTTVSEQAFARVAVREGSDGLVVVFKAREATLATLKLSAAPLLLAVEGVEKPGNLGALVRTADGAGCDAVIALGATVDRYNPHAIRASLGTVFSVPVVAATNATLRAFCATNGLRVVAAALSPRAKSWSKVDYRGGTVVLLGSEAEGLSQAWLDGADDVVTLPMGGMADSLNVGAAGAAILYEAVRQRTAP